MPPSLNFSQGLCSKLSQCETRRCRVRTNGNRRHCCNFARAITRCTACNIIQLTAPWLLWLSICCVAVLHFTNSKSRVLDLNWRLSRDSGWTVRQALAHTPSSIHEIATTANEEFDYGEHQV
jgi:hypothetical protein